MTSDIELLGLPSVNKLPDAWRTSDRVGVCASAGISALRMELRRYAIG
ncbi:hypothetical protein X738_27840 [Mesorhizobium sp. LNHC209A00]|nr:hypothetical protein X738_27840 [Mesorhizobium sp. LNHC209A00]